MPTQSNKEGARSRLLFLLPLGLFLALAGFLFVGLYLGDPSEIPSALIGDPAPEFELPSIEGDPSALTGLSKADFMETEGGLALLNVWASWCGPCRYEHPLLMDIAEQGEIPIFGLNYKDEPQDALAFLASLGNPYIRSGADKAGRVGIDFGVYGVPETFLINDKGEILYKHVGPLTEESWNTKLKPLIKAARQSDTRPS